MHGSQNCINLCAWKSGITRPSGSLDFYIVIICSDISREQNDQVTIISREMWIPPLAMGFTSWLCRASCQTDIMGTSLNRLNWLNFIALLHLIRWNHGCFGLISCRGDSDKTEMGDQKQIRIDADTLRWGVDRQTNSQIVQTSWPLT